jgi:hypothetical protein
LNFQRTTPLNIPKIKEPSILVLGKNSESNNCQSWLFQASQKTFSFHERTHEKFKSVQLQVL